MKTVVKLKSVSKVYRMDEVEVRALDNINLEVKENDLIAIMGPSGSGKSTLLNIIGLLDRPSSGKIFFEDVDVSKLNDNELAKFRNKKIGFVFQFFNLYPTLNALENVELPMIIAEDNYDKKERALELLRAVGLEKRCYHLPSQLSGGERQRVAIARALVNNPSLILADEPTGNLDSKSGKEIIELLTELHEKGKTIVIVTHEPRIAKYAEKIIYIKDGKIIKEV